YAAVPAEVLRPLVAEAHRQGLQVWAHAALFPARPSEVVRAGVDVVSHASLLVWEGVPILPPATERRRPDPILPADHPKMHALLALMAERKTLLDATLFVLGESGPQAKWSADIVRAAAKAGVPLTAGTDSIGTDGEGDLPNIHRELQLLVERGGLSPIAALVAATSNAARALGIDSTHGIIAEGKAADLVVLSADPTADIRHTRDIVAVFKGGRRY